MNIEELLQSAGKQITPPRTKVRSLISSLPQKNTRAWLKILVPALAILFVVIMRTTPKHSAVLTQDELSEFDTQLADLDTFYEDMEDEDALLDASL